MASTRQPQGKQDQPVKSKGWGFSGKASRDQFEKETQAVKERKEKQERERAEREVPHRFGLKPGESRDIIILDDSFETGGHAFYEQAIFQDKIGINYEVSPMTDGHECPLEELTDSWDKPYKPYYVKYISVLVMGPFERVKRDKDTKKPIKDRNGDPVMETVVDADGNPVPYYRNLMGVKYQQMGEFLNISEACVEDYGTFRGVKIRMTRPDEKMSPKTGAPSPISLEGKVSNGYKRYTEEQLIKEFGHPARKDKEGKKVLVEENEYLQPFDYLSGKVFHLEVDKDGDPDWTAQTAALRKKYKLGSVMGSAQEEEETWGEVAASQSDNVNRKSQMEDEEDTTISSSDIDTTETVPF